MKYCVLSLLLVIGCVYAAPVEQGGVEQGSCKDAVALGAAEQALAKINQDRKEGYILKMHRLSNVNMMTHGETGMVFYLTLDVVETNCHVLSRKDAKDCEARPTEDTPVYGRCKAVIYMNRVHRVVRLYKYDCAIRPAPAAKVSDVCPDCPSHSALDDANIVQTVTTALAKYNKENGLTNHFALLSVTRAVSQMGMAVFYNPEFTIQETICDKSKDPAKDACPLMECEFAHKGFCKASRHVPQSGDDEVTVECEIYEPEPAEREKKLHLLGGETDHSHNETRVQDRSLAHDHEHNHAVSHAHNDKAGTHATDSEHHHTHDHGSGSNHRHAHAHAHSHDHGHGHDHVHAHHAKAHDHSGDSPSHHHDYKHAAAANIHDHDHELALDHDHKHAHLHEHEHHHHHHEHEHETSSHNHPEGMVRTLPAMDQPMTLPSFPDVPAAGPEQGVTLPLRPDPQIPGEMEPTILPFPKAMSAQCPAPDGPGTTLVEQLFAADAMFKPAA